MAKDRTEPYQPTQRPSMAEKVEELAREIFIILVTSTIGGTRTPESLAETARKQAEAFYGLTTAQKEAA